MNKRITVILTGPAHVRIFWGDGVIEDHQIAEGVEQPVEHIYANDGQYEVRVRGVAHAIRIGQNHTVYEVVDFGDMDSTHYRFSSNVNLHTVPDTLPTSVRNIEWMFDECREFSGDDIVGWDVSRVVEGNGAFYNSGLTADLGAWNTVSFREMTHMFSSPDVWADVRYYNHNLSCWNVEAIITQPMGFREHNEVWLDEYQPRWGQSITDVSGRTGASCYIAPPPAPRYEITVEYAYGEGQEIILQLNDQRVMQDNGLMTDPNVYKHAINDEMVFSGIRDYESTSGNWDDAIVPVDKRWSWVLWYNGEIISESNDVEIDIPTLGTTGARPPGNYSIQVTAFIKDSSTNEWVHATTSKFSYGEWPEPEPETIYGYLLETWADGIVLNQIEDDGGNNIPPPQST